MNIYTLTKVAIPTVTYCNSTEYSQSVITTAKESERNRITVAHQKSITTLKFTILHLKVTLYIRKEFRD